MRGRGQRHFFGLMGLWQAKWVRTLAASTLAAARFAAQRPLRGAAAPWLDGSRQRTADLGRRRFFLQSGGAGRPTRLPQRTNG